MPKFHIKPSTGDPGVCKANSGNCPFGSESEHYTSAEAAREAFEVKMNSASDIATLRKDTLPNLTALYKAAPRANIGISKVYGLLNGIQEDIDSGFIDTDRAQAKIAAVALKLEEAERVYNPSSTKAPKSETDHTTAEANRKAFVEDLRKLSGGATPASPLDSDKAWASVSSAAQELMYSGKLDKEKGRKLELLTQTLRGTPFIYEGASDTRALRLARETQDIFAKARKPELVELHTLITTAIENDGRLEQRGNN